MTDMINRYRPNNLDEVIGHDDEVNALYAAIENRTASQFLFSGPSGVGKTTLARITLHMLGCDPLNIEEIDGASETGIDNIRERIAEVMYLPLRGARRGILIDEAHALSANANKALLKSLEEPPPHVVWCLCTTAPTKLDKAIITRCLHFALKGLSTNDLIGLLQCTDEGHDLDPEILQVCAREAEGSPRQALANLGICFGAKSREEAGRLLRTAGDAPQAFELARLLMKGASWRDISDMLEQMKALNSESIRQVIRAYATTTALKSDKPAQALSLLEKFSQPCHSADGISPIVLACARLVFNQ